MLETLPAPAEVDAFLAAIHAAPTEFGPRLIFADWLDEQGDPGASAWAEFIRVQLERERPSKLNRSKARRAALLRREQELLRDWQSMWLGRWARAGVVWTFTGGFPSAFDASFSDRNGHLLVSWLSMTFTANGRWTDTSAPGWGTFRNRTRGHYRLFLYRQSLMMRLSVWHDRQNDQFFAGHLGFEGGDELFIRLQETRRDGTPLPNRSIVILTRNIPGAGHELTSSEEPASRQP